MTSRSFRRLFPQINVQYIPEDEFYRQASLSQLLTGPDEQELASFRPDVKDPLELVEATPELAGMLGSSLEFVDSRWDSLEASPPPTPSPPPSPRRQQCIPPSLASEQYGPEPCPKVESVVLNRTESRGQGFKNLGYSTPAAKAETKVDISMWEPQKQGSKISAGPTPAKLNATLNASLWEPQRQRSKTPQVVDSVNPECKTDSNLWEQPQQGNKTVEITSVKSDVMAGASMWEPQRLRSRSAVNSDAKLDTAVSEPPRLRNKNPGNTTPAHSSGAVDANMWKRQNQGNKGARVLDSANPVSAVDCGVWEPQRLRSKNAVMSGPAKLDVRVDASTWECQGIKRMGGNSTAPKREANPCGTQGEGTKTIKMDPAWQRNLANVRVHIRDLGMKVGAIARDVKKEPGKMVGKGARVKGKS